MEGQRWHFSTCTVSTKIRVRTSARAIPLGLGVPATASRQDGRLPLPNTQAGNTTPRNEHRRRSVAVLAASRRRPRRTGRRGSPRNRAASIRARSSRFSRPRGASPESAARQGAATPEMAARSSDFPSAPDEPRSLLSAVSGLPSRSVDEGRGADWTASHSRWLVLRSIHISESFPH